MFDCAIVWGHRPEADGNPCKGTVRYRLPPSGRLLGEAARDLLHGLAETASGEWVFPDGKGNGSLGTDDLWRPWIKVRDAVGIVADARLHDLRHAHASHVVMSGESLHVTGRMIGHRRASTTNRYVHLDDETLSQAAERVAAAIHRLTDRRV